MDGYFVEQSYLLGNKPVIFNSLNITPPGPGEPPLATADDVNTMFHEFGHALHGSSRARNTRASRAPTRRGFCGVSEPIQ